MAKVEMRPSGTTKAPESTSLPEWAVYIYMKPDQALEEFAERDIQEMAAGVTGSAVPVVVHLEQQRDVQRLLIADGEARPVPDSWTGATYPTRIPATTGSLEEFLAWASRNYRSRQRLVVLWGHSRGVGIDLVGPSSMQVDQPSGPVPESVSLSPSGPAPDGLPLDTLLEVGTKLSGLARAAGASGKEIDVLGLDSCYMSSAEYAHALRTRVGFLVAAEGAVKRTGWNYRVILNELSRSPSLTPAGVARIIVDHVGSLDGDLSLAKLDLEKSPDFVAAFKELVDALLQAIQDADEAHALFIALKRTSYFQVRQFLDVRDLCHRLRSTFNGDVARMATRALVAYNALVYSRSTGVARGRLNGVSVFCPLFRAQLPFGDDTPDVDAVVDLDVYRALDFVTATRWLALCDALKPRLAFSRL